MEEKIRKVWELLDTLGKEVMRGGLMYLLRVAEESADTMDVEEEPSYRVPSTPQEEMRDVMVGTGALLGYLSGLLANTPGGADLQDATNTYAKALTKALVMAYPDGTPEPVPGGLTGVN